MMENVVEMREARSLVDAAAAADAHVGELAELSVSVSEVKEETEEEVDAKQELSVIVHPHDDSHDSELLSPGKILPTSMIRVCSMDFRSLQPEPTYQTLTSVDVVATPFPPKLTSQPTATLKLRNVSPNNTMGGQGSQAGEPEEINTKELAQRISADLKRYGIPQSIFAERVLCRTGSTVSVLLRNPKPWSKLKCGRKIFRRMWKWLQEPEAQRMADLRLAVKETIMRVEETMSRWSRSSVTPQRQPPALITPVQVRQVAQTAEPAAPEALAEARELVRAMCLRDRGLRPVEVVAAVAETASPDVRAALDQHRQTISNRVPVWRAKDKVGE